MKILVQFNMEVCRRTMQECKHAGFGQFNDGRVIDTGPGPDGETPSAAFKRWAATEPQPAGSRLNPFYLRIEEVQS